jgi:hypothetical protein
VYGLSILKCSKEDDVVECVDVRGRMDGNSFDDKGREGLCRGNSRLWGVCRAVGGVESEE